MGPSPIRKAGQWGTSLSGLPCRWMASSPTPMIKSVRCSTGIAMETSTSPAVTPTWRSTCRPPLLNTYARPGGVQSAVAQARAFPGDRDVSLTAGNLAGQALRAGLIDEVRIDLVPVVFGSGVRYFGNYDESTSLLEDPEVVQGERVTHLHYRIRK